MADLMAQGAPSSNRRNRGDHREQDIPHGEDAKSTGEHAGSGKRLDQSTVRKSESAFHTGIDIF